METLRDQYCKEKELSYLHFIKSAYLDYIEWLENKLEEQEKCYYCNENFKEEHEPDKYACTECRNSM